MDDSVYLIYIVPELTIRTVWTIIENQPTNECKLRFHRKFLRVFNNIKQNKNSLKHYENILEAKCKVDYIHFLLFCHVTTISSY